MMEDPASAAVARQASTRPTANAFMLPRRHVIRRIAKRLRLLETESNGRTAAALGAIGCAARGTEYRHQGFSCIATDLAGCLNRSDGSGGRPGIALGAGRTLWPLWPLGTLLPLSAGHTLHALYTLRPGRSLGPGIPFRSRIPSAPCKSQCRAHQDHHQNPSHSVPPPDFP